MSPGKLISTPAASLIILFFFLPWVTVSCGGQELATLSGMDLAAGPEVDTGFGVERAEGEPLLFLIPLMALIGGGFALARKQGTGQGLAVIQAAASLIGVAILFLKWTSLSDNAREAGLQVSGEFGLWGTALALFGLLAGGLIAFMESKPTKQDDHYYDPYSSGMSEW